MQPNSCPRRGTPTFAPGRAYYAMFHVAQALLFEEGLSFNKHGAVHSAYGRLFAKTGRLDPKFHRWLIDAFDTRSLADCGEDVTLGERETLDLLNNARRFAAEARRLLGSEGT